MNKKTPYVLCLLLFAFLTTPGQQQQTISPKEAELIKQRVHETAKKTTTIESDFVQEKEMSVLSEKIISKGKFYFKKEKRLRWEYTAPFPYMIIINNDQMYVKDDNTENRVNMQSNKVFRDINNIILGAVQGTLLSDQKNFQSAFSDSRTYYVVKIVPQSAKIKESLSEIILYFNKNDYSVERLLMREASGDYTRIDFKEKKINQQISDEKFIIP